MKSLSLKRYFILVIVLLMGSWIYFILNFLHGKERYPGKINSMSINIRYNNPADGQNAWPFRRERVAGTIHFHNADIAVLQEVLWNQIQDLDTLLPEYNWIGAGRDDGKKQGEFSPVYYKKHRFRVLDHSTFWLSDFPDVDGSRGWDAACPRIVTWGRFEDIRTGVPFYIFNTHFDHVGVKARIESARLLLRKIHEIAGGAPVILTGDFNSTEKDSAYIILTRSDGIHSPLIDTYSFPGIHRYGATQTFTGFQEEIRPGYRIDFIFIHNIQKVLRFGILWEKWDGQFVSDHNPVIAQIVIE